MSGASRLLVSRTRLSGSERAAPHLLPPVIADSQTERQHGIDVLAFPMHTWSLEAGLHHQLVGAFDRAGANRPALCSGLWILDQGFPFAQILHMLLDAFLLRKFWGKTSSHTQKRGGTTMLEDMQTAREHLVRQPQVRLRTSFQQRTQVFGGVGEVQNAHHIRPIPVGKCLTPLGSVRHNTYLFGLRNETPSHLSCNQFDERGGIRKTRKIRELPHVYLCFPIDSRLALWLPDSGGAHLNPLLVNQRDHGPVGTHYAPFGRRLL